MLTIRPITAEETIAVRWPILRPGFPRESAVFAGDELTSARHFGAFAGDGRLVGVASIYVVAMPEPAAAAAGAPVPEGAAWQLRGMATLPEVRGAGYGAALVSACEEGARAAGGEVLWCNARTSAAPFYQKHGWSVVGGEFDIPTVGPHFRMWRQIAILQ